jgi:hypothetical protein
LIIKKKKDVVIKKNIGRIFRSFNVVEYKSPTDRATIADYHKTQCYARLYAALNKTDIDDMSVSVVATHHPRKLLSFLKRKYTVEQVQSGIYSVEEDTCPTQIIVSEELPESDNLWLNSLRNDLTIAQLERFAQAPHQTLPMDAFVNVFSEANAEELEEMYMRKKNGVILTEKLDALFGAPYFAKGEAQGIAVGEARGEARGEMKGKAVMLLNVLRARFKTVPKETEKAILAMTDSIALDSWAVQTATCSSMKEFAAALKQ